MRAPAFASRCDHNSSRPVGSRVKAALRRRRGRPLSVALLCGLALALGLVGCGTTSSAIPAATAAARAAATSTAAAQATATAQPVTLATTLAQRGTVAANDVQLIATVTIANHTNAAIHLASNFCLTDRAHTTGGRPDGHVPTIVLEMRDELGHAVYASWGGIACPNGVAGHVIDVQEIPAGGAFMATLTCDLASGLVQGTELRAGVPYTTQVKVFLWHQGTPEQYLEAFNHPDQPGVQWGANLMVKQPFTFACAPGHLPWPSLRGRGPPGRLPALVLCLVDGTYRSLGYRTNAPGTWRKD